MCMYAVGLPVWAFSCFLLCLKKNNFKHYSSVGCCELRNERHLNDNSCMCFGLVFGVSYFCCFHTYFCYFCQLLLFFWSTSPMSMAQWLVCPLWVQRPKVQILTQCWYGDTWWDSKFDLRLLSQCGSTCLWYVFPVIGTLNNQGKLIWLTHWHFLQKC